MPIRSRFSTSIDASTPAPTVNGPAGAVATTMHKGAYTDLGAAYEALNAYLQLKGLHPSGVVYEFYHNAPNEVKPEDLLTEIVFPLA